MKKALVIAHRGYTRHFPDNTLEAFRAAREIGVDGVEFDIQETADGAFVVFHDGSIGGKNISGLKSEDIGMLRVGGNCRIPTLQQALEVLGGGWCCWWNSNRSGRWKNSSHCCAGMPMPLLRCWFLSMLP